jgi:hypothetical protein
LGGIYGDKHRTTQSRFVSGDLCSGASIIAEVGRCSHVITSPPYINAQDYFRNFKLELYILEGVLPFTVEQVRKRFIGTDRGNLLAGIPDAFISHNLVMLPELKQLASISRRLAAVVHRYLFDMTSAFGVIKTCLDPGGKLVLVCGDNLVGGIRIRTWEVLRAILQNQGFVVFDEFSDRIENRMLAPKRSGHKGLIKEEVVCAFYKSGGEKTPAKCHESPCSGATS